MNRRHEPLDHDERALAQLLAAGDDDMPSPEMDARILAAARAALADDDRELLYLRVDRQLPWREIAVIMSDEGAGPDDEAVRKLDQALRKRFESVKRRLKAKLEAG